MQDPRWAEVDRYTEELLVGPDPVLERVLEAGRAAGLPQIQVTPNQGRFLYSLARATRARRILEIGTLAGYSTVWLARALGPGGRLVTLERDARHAEVARANLAEAGVLSRVEVRVGAALDLLQGIRLSSTRPFDLVFVDADKPSYPEYARLALDLTRPGGMIVIDNVVRAGAVADPDDPDPSVRGVRAMNAFLSTDPRAIVTTLQTVGAKGYDGMALVLVARVPPVRSRGPAVTRPGSAREARPDPPRASTPQRRRRGRP